MNRWPPARRAPLAVGIGLSFGEVVFGDVGSRDRRDFTVVGDAVNVAARLQDMTKALGCPVLLTERAAVRTCSRRDGAARRFRDAAHQGTQCDSRMGLAPRWCWQFRKRRRSRRVNFRRAVQDAAHIPGRGFKIRSRRAITKAARAGRRCPIDKAISGCTRCSLRRSLS